MVETAPDDTHLGFVDGIRGLLAFWVFFYHAATLAGWHAARFPAGSIAVDLFMLLSGLLMTWNFAVRESVEPLASPKTIAKFFTRRFFRIAPLFYLSLAVALALAPNFDRWIAHVWQVFPPPWADYLQRDPSSHEPFWASLLTHLTFLFGLFPRFAANDVLPDWSLTLEMQFYSVIPFLLLVVRRTGWPVVVVAALALQLWSLGHFGTYITSNAAIVWPQPTVLPFRIGCFIAGALIATYARGARTVEMVVLLVLAIGLSGSSIFAAGALAILLLMTRDGSAQRLRASASALLSSWPARLAGDLSYGVYLTHTLALWPLASMLASNPAYVHLPAPLRAAVLFGSATLVIVPLAYALHRIVERPGIALGRRAAALVPPSSRPPMISSDLAKAKMP